MNANITIKMTITAHPIRDVDENGKVPANSSLSKRNDRINPAAPKNTGYPQL